MTRDSIISDLQALLKQIQDVDVLEAKSKEAKEQLDVAESICPKLVNEFDLKNKDKYIISKIGNKPIEPKGLNKLFKNKEYNSLLSQYNNNYLEVEKQYYVDFAKQRTDIYNTEQSEIQNNINIAKKQYEDVLNLLNTTKLSITNNTLLNDKYKTIPVINKLLNYLHEQRADSIKEAINLSYEEERYEKLEEITRQEINGIRDIALQAISKANEAINIANQANNNAQDAESTALQALNEASQAKAATIALM